MYKLHQSVSSQIRSTEIPFKVYTGREGGRERESTWVGGQRWEQGGAPARSVVGQRCQHEPVGVHDPLPGVDGRVHIVEEEGHQ